MSIIYIATTSFSALVPVERAALPPDIVGYWKPGCPHHLLLFDQLLALSVTAVAAFTRQVDNRYACVTPIFADILAINKQSCQYHQASTPCRLLGGRGWEGLRAVVPHMLLLEPRELNGIQKAIGGNRTTCTACLLGDGGQSPLDAGSGMNSVSTDKHTEKTGHRRCVATIALIECSPRYLARPSFLPRLQVAMLPPPSRYLSLPRCCKVWIRRRPRSAQQVRCSMHSSGSNIYFRAAVMRRPR